MTGINRRGELIRKFITENVEKHPSEIAKITADEFQISRQAVNKHLSRLVAEKTLTTEGSTRNRVYRLHPIVSWIGSYDLTKPLEEDAVWREQIASRIGEMPDNVAGIWNYCFTEMLNNTIDHSGGSTVAIILKRTALTMEITISDDGVGIFEKIQKALNLTDPRHAVLELAKGKLTTDPANHSGEGIFFTSRMCDLFGILSGTTYFSHHFNTPQDWILETDNRVKKGTAVFMKLNNHTSRTVQKVFNEYSDVDAGFNKTVVPVTLAQYEKELLVSRSQAKRVLARVDRFAHVIFDFDKVGSIGQAFADEIFRVFASQHPEVELSAINTFPEVQQMINRAIALKAESESD